MNELTVNDVLELVRKYAQQCRENGESDMRNILYCIRYIKYAIESGKSREEIIGAWEEDDE